MGGALAFSLLFPLISLLLSSLLFYLIFLLYFLLILSLIFSHRLLLSLSPFSLFRSPLSVFLFPFPSLLSPSLISRTARAKTGGAAEKGPRRCLARRPRLTWRPRERSARVFFAWYRREDVE